MTLRNLQVQNARDLGPLFTDNPHRMVGQDGAFSFPLADGSSFWFFGDTLIGKRVPDQSPWIVDGHLVDHRDMSGQGTYERMINNTGLILPKQTGERGLRDFRYILDARGQLKNLLPLENDEHPDWDRIWCQGGMAVGEKIILSFIQVRMIEKYDGPLPIGFEIVGSGLAVGSNREFTFTRVRRNGTHLLWKENEPHFGIAFLPSDDGSTIFVYGTVNEKTGHQCYVARVPAALVHDVDAYEFHAGGNAWRKDPKTAQPLFGGMPSEMSVSYNAHLAAYLAVHSLDLTGKLVARTAPDPWGPWSKPITLWQVNAKPSYPPPYPFPLIYAGKEHHQLAKDNGKTIYLTYIEFEEYFPHLIEVTLQ